MSIDFGFGQSLKISHIEIVKAVLEISDHRGKKSLWPNEIAYFKSNILWQTETTLSIKFKQIAQDLQFLHLFIAKSSFHSK